LDNENFHWVGMPHIAAVRIEGHSSADWWLWPEQVSAWCDEHHLTYYDLIPYVALANGEIVMGEAK
jgi:hypothetical protein